MWHCEGDWDKKRQKWAATCDAYKSVNWLRMAARRALGWMGMFKGPAGYLDMIDLLSCVHVQVWLSNWCVHLSIIKYPWIQLYMSMVYATAYVHILNMMNLRSGTGMQKPRGVYVLFLWTLFVLIFRLENINEMKRHIHLKIELW